MESVVFIDVAMLCSGSADALREEVMQSSWYEAFRSDMRSSVVVRAVESSVGRIGAATHAATSWTSSQLASTGQGLRYAAPPDPHPQIIQLQSSQCVLYHHGYIRSICSQGFVIRDS